MHARLRASTSVGAALGSVVALVAGALGVAVALDGPVEPQALVAIATARVAVVDAFRFEGVAESTFDVDPGGPPVEHLALRVEVAGDRSLLVAHDATASLSLLRADVDLYGRFEVSGVDGGWLDLGAAAPSGDVDPDALDPATRDPRAIPELLAAAVDPRLVDDHAGVLTFAVGFDPPADSPFVPGPGLVAPTGELRVDRAGRVVGFTVAVSTGFAGTARRSVLVVDDVEWGARDVRIEVPAPDELGDPGAWDELVESIPEGPVTEPAETGATGGSPGTGIGAVDEAVVGFDEFALWEPAALPVGWERVAVEVFEDGSACTNVVVHYADAAGGSDDLVLVMRHEKCTTLLPARSVELRLPWGSGWYDEPDGEHSAEVVFHGTRISVTSALDLGRLRVVLDEITPFDGSRAVPATLVLPPPDPVEFQAVPSVLVGPDAPALWQPAALPPGWTFDSVHVGGSLDPGCQPIEIKWASPGRADVLVWQQVPAGCSRPGILADWVEEPVTWGAVRCDDAVRSCVAAWSGSEIRSQRAGPAVVRAVLEAPPVPFDPGAPPPGTLDVEG